MKSGPYLKSVWCFLHQKGLRLQELYLYCICNAVLKLNMLSLLTDKMKCRIVKKFPFNDYMSCHLVISVHHGNWRHLQLLLLQIPLIEEFIRDQSCNLLLDVPRFRDGSEVTSCHQQTSYQLFVVLVGPGQGTVGYQRKCFSSVLEIYGQVSGQNSFFYK